MTAPEVDETARAEALIAEAKAALPEDRTPTVVEAINAVMRAVKVVTKDQKIDPKARMGNWSFRGIDDVINAVGPALRAVGVIVVPETILDYVYEVAEVGSDKKAMSSVRVRVLYRWYGPDGKSIPTESVGESFDSGDKGSTKAMSVAFRTNMIQTLCLPTDERDPDSDAYERTHRADRRRADDDGGRVIGSDPEGQQEHSRADRWDDPIAEAIRGGEQAIRAIWKDALHGGASKTQMDRMAQALQAIKAAAEAGPPAEDVPPPPADAPSEPDGPAPEGSARPEHPKRPTKAELAEKDRAALAARKKLVLDRWIDDLRKAKAENNIDSGIWDDLLTRLQQFEPLLQEELKVEFSAGLNSARLARAESDEPPF